MKVHLLYCRIEYFGRHGWDVGALHPMLGTMHPDKLLPFRVAILQPE
jgi:hypothetical protein